MSRSQSGTILRFALILLALLFLSVHVQARPEGKPPSWHTKIKAYNDTLCPTATTTYGVTSSASSASSSTSGAPTYTAPPGTASKPKVLLIGNTFEFGYLSTLNFTTAYTGPLFDSLYACTTDGQICKLECGQELVSAQQITALALIPGIDLRQTYIFITGTGGVNPKYGTAGGAAIAKYSVQWEWGGMFLGTDLPANFSGQYFYSYAQDSPAKYPSLVGTEVYELNEALVDRFYNLTTNLTFADVTPALQTLRSTYVYEPARRAPFLAKCDVVSAQVYWHGNVAGENMEYYSNVVTSGAAKPCNTNEDDQGRLVALVGAAKHGLLDFGRVSMIKAFSNFDRPPPQLTAFQSRYEVGEGATVPGLTNSWNVIMTAVGDILSRWDSLYAAGIAAPNYVGDAKGSLGGTPEFVRNSSAVAGSVQGS